MTSELLDVTPGYDWVVHYRADDDEVQLFPVLGRETMEEVLDVACLWLEQANGLGGYEIIGILRRDIIGNADELIPRNLN